jgi:hypothetical protein
VLALLDEGANIEVIDEVRAFSCICLVSLLGVLECMFVQCRQISSVCAVEEIDIVYVPNLRQSLFASPSRFPCEPLDVFCTCILAKPQGGSTALIRAAHEGRTECVRLLLEAGAVKNTQNLVRVIAAYRVSMCLFFHICVRLQSQCLLPYRFLANLFFHCR